MSLTHQFQGFTVDGNTPTTSDEVYIDPGRTKRIRFAFKNTGTDTWTNTGANAVKLGTANPHDRASGFSNGATAYGWLSTSRIAMEESSVPTNSVAHFTADFVGCPEATNRYIEYFTPVKEGVAWITPDPNAYIALDMRPIGTTLFNWHVAANGGNYRWGTHPYSPTQSTTDTPMIGNGTTVDDGYYTTMNPDVAYRKLELLNNAGFNFLLLNRDGHGGIAERGFFQIVKQIQDNSEFGHFRYAPFFTVGAGYSEFNYLYDLASADAHWARWNGKPMIATWGHAGSSDSRFVMPSMGSNDTSCTWHWETFPGGPSQVLNDAGTVIPRYDDRVCFGTYGKPGSAVTWNIDLNTSMFSDQFNTVKTAWNNGTIKFAFFNAWDEYHERQGPIEPHVDANVSGVTPGSLANDLLYTTTSGYVNQLRS